MFFSSAVLLSIRLTLRSCMAFFVVWVALDYFYLCQARNMHAGGRDTTTHFWPKWHQQKWKLTYDGICGTVQWICYRSKKRGLYIVFWQMIHLEGKKKSEKDERNEADHSSMLGCCVWRMVTNPTRMSEGCQKYYRRIYVLVKQSIMCLTHVVFFSRTFFHLWLRLENEC